MCYFAERQNSAKWRSAPLRQLGNLRKTKRMKQHAPATFAAVIWLAVSFLIAKMPNIIRHETVLIVAVSIISAANLCVGKEVPHFME